MEPHNSRFAKISGARFAPPMGAMPHPTLMIRILGCVLIMVLNKIKINIKNTNNKIKINNNNNKYLDIVVCNFVFNPLQAPL